MPNARFLKKHTTGFSKNHLVTTWSTSLQGFIFHRNFSPVWSKMGHSILEGRFKFQSPLCQFLITFHRRKLLVPAKMKRRIF